jgi:hypothetical protein
MNYHQVSVAAESFTAALFAWAGFDISVQYGANQPEYDLVVVKGDKMRKVSGWRLGVNSRFKKGKDLF